MSLHYVVGDATRPQYGEGHRLIIHVCNIAGGWGAGFVLALSRRWKQPELRFRRCHRTGVDSQLGDIQTVPVDQHHVVVNMMAQRHYGLENEIPLSYDALALCLSKVHQLAHDKPGTTIHGPRFGAGLAGGDWTKIEKLINHTIAKDFDVYIYDLP